MDAEIVRQSVLSELTEQFHPASIVERVEPRVRQLEDLPPRESGLLSGEKTSTIFTMNGIQFHFDALEGQKTGAFLDPVSYTHLDVYKRQELYRYAS